MGVIFFFGQNLFDPDFHRLLSLNPLTKNTYNKYENVVSKYYMMRNTSKIALKNDAKNHSQQQLTWKKLSHGHVCPGH